jgi:hypothetical protein
MVGGNPLLTPAAAGWSRIERQRSELARETLSVTLEERLRRGERLSRQAVRLLNAVREAELAGRAT